MNPLDLTLFSRSHLTFRQALQVLYCFAASFSVKTAVEQLAISKKTIIDWFNIARQVPKYFGDNSTIIGGPGLTVEIDESHIYRRKYNRGRQPVLSSVWVVGGVCRETGQCFIEKTEIRDQQTLHDIIRRRVHWGSIIITDFWRGYLGVVDACNMAAHFRVNHKLRFAETIKIDDDNDGIEIHVHTNTIERLWRELKRSIKCVREYTNDKGDLVHWVDTYLHRFSYFHNVLDCLPSDDQRFERFLEDIKVAFPGLSPLSTNTIEDLSSDSGSEIEYSHDEFDDDDSDKD